MTLLDKITEKEVRQGMTNAQTAALLEALKIITEKADSLEDIKKALDRLQSQVTGKISE